MKIITFGDIHDGTLNLIRLASEFENADKIIFVGDGARSLEVLDKSARRKLVAVHGNCDFFSRLPLEVFVDGIFVTHGHKYGAKGGSDALVAAAKARGAKLCLFGHNHMPSHVVTDGIVFVNPGSLGRRRTHVPNSYAVVTFCGEEISVDLKTIAI